MQIYNQLGQSNNMTFYKIKDIRKMTKTMKSQDIDQFRKGTIILCFLMIITIEYKGPVNLLTQILYIIQERL